MCSPSSEIALYFVVGRGRLGQSVDGADTLVLNSVSPGDHHRVHVAPNHLRVVTIAAINISTFTHIRTRILLL